MDEIEIKHEFDSGIQAQCKACLSFGRKLLPVVSQYRDIYNKITLEFAEPLCANSELDSVCWECHALLRRVAQFQCKVKRAGDLLRLQQNCLYTLSNLTCVTFNDQHPHTIYVNESNTQTHTKSEEQLQENCDTQTDNSDTIGDSYTNESCLGRSIDGVKTEIECGTDEKKVKLASRWAKKRAIQNKKTKFKVVTDYRVIFKKVPINNEDSSYREEINRLCYTSKKFKCQHCILSFNKENSLIAHNERFHDKCKRPYVCDTCERTFSNKRHLSSHIRNHSYKYECKLCEFVCDDVKQKRSHVDKKHRSVFQCLKCQLMFCTRREFFEHYKQWHENFVCDHCGVSFKMRYSIKDHIRKQHSPFECKPCKKTFARYNGLWLHKKLCHSPTGQAAYCVECDKKYVDIYRYRWHLRNSAKHKPRMKLSIPCPACEKNFTKHIYMKDHYNFVHLKLIKYKCDECDKKFTRNADLVNHKRRIHEGILPPKNKICYVCGRGFATNNTLKNHIRTHTGERPFACRSCPQRFAQRSALVTHTRGVHKRDQLDVH